MVALSKSVMKNRMNRPLVDKWRHILLAIKPIILVYIYKSNSLLSTLLNKNCIWQLFPYFMCILLKLQLVNFILNAYQSIKNRYLRDHASQIKSYYGTLSGSHGRSFRIRYAKSPEAPPGGEITMMSYDRFKHNTKIELINKPEVNTTLLLPTVTSPKWR